MRFDEIWLKWFFSSHFSTDSACPTISALRTVESFMYTCITSPSNCLPRFHTIGSRYIVMHESCELNTSESHTACTSSR